MLHVKIIVTPDGRLSRRDAASYLGLSTKTLANWHTRGIGPRCFRVGGRCFYRLNDLMGFVADAGRSLAFPPTQSEVGLSGHAVEGAAYGQ